MVVTDGITCIDFPVFPAWRPPLPIPSEENPDPIQPDRYLFSWLVEKAKCQKQYVQYQSVLALVRPSPLANKTVTWNQTSIPLSSFFDDFFRFLSLLAGSFPFSSWEKVRRMPIRCSFLWAGVIHQRSHWKSLLRGPKWGPIFCTSHKLKAINLASEMEY